MKRADVRMIQRADCEGLALEAVVEIRIRGEVRREDFDGNSAIEASVSRLVNLAHATGTERRDDLVGREPSANS